jgi:FkbM family methyltransferase
VSENRPAILSIVDSPPVIDVVDVGANPIDGHALYKSLLDAGAARVIGFEPNPDALAKLHAAAGANETYLPDALGDGGEHELQITRASGMSSILPPNTNLFSYFHGFETWGEVRRTIRVPTTRLDDIDAIKNVDLLKIDVEGYELEILRHGLAKLGMAVVVQIEVHFIPMHIGQPLFSDVDIFMRQHGFMIHKFAGIHSRVLKPLVVNDSAYSGLSQIVWTDALYVRDFTRFDELPAEKLLKAAIMLHESYGSPDLANLALIAYDRKQGTDLSARFLHDVLKISAAVG